MNNTSEKSIHYEPGQFLLSKEELSRLHYLNYDEIAKARKVKDLCKKKRAVMKEIWSSSEGDIEGRFLTYPFSSEVAITANELLNMADTKLVRDDHRIYFGEIKKSKKYGKGISVYSDGKIYEGHHEDNQKCGIGCQLYKNGNAYIGNFVKNKKHGDGKMYWLNLDENGIVEYYIGQWWDGLPSGSGKHQRCNGDLYEGEFKNGLKHGDGVEHFSNGDCYVGKYVNGLPDGYGEYTWANKSNYKGEFKQGVRSGIGSWRKNQTENSESYNGSYSHDYKQGYGVYTWPDGRRYNGEFLRDKRNGIGEMYQNQVLKYKGKWIDGKPIENNEVRDTSVNRMRSSSIEFKYFHVKNKPDMRNQNTSSTLKIMSLRSTTRLRKGTFESGSSESATNIGLKRPSSVIDFDQKQLTNNSIYKAIKSRQLDSNLKDRHENSKCRHKNCIPSYPWQRSQSTIRH